MFADYWNTDHLPMQYKIYSAYENDKANLLKVILTLVRTFSQNMVG